MSSKILERLIYARVKTIINPLLPQEQTGFRHGKLTVDQVTLLTQDIEDSFSTEKKAGAVFVDLTAAYGVPQGYVLQMEQVMTPQEQRPTGICPGTPSLQHLRL